MPSTPEPHEQWYVLHVLSGQENSVRDRIIRKAKDAELSDFIYRVEVPTELISEVRNGKKTERHSKLFPGYVYANMYLLEADGVVARHVFAQVPPRVEYELTELGRSLEPLLLQMRDWGERFKATAQSRRPDQSGASSATPPLARHASIKQGELAT